MTSILSMPIPSFHPRLTRAECEFWFEAGPDWQEQMEQRMETSLALAFPDVSNAAEPFLWFEPNYLAILSGPTGSAEAHADVKTHSGYITRALAAYQDAAHPHRVQTLFLNYRFEFDAGILPCGPRKTIWKTPREMLTLEREQTCTDESQTHLALRCLVTHPPASCLTRPEHWLWHVHHRMEGAFFEMQQGVPFPH